jgi:uncharacterized protein
MRQLTDLYLSKDFIETEEGLCFAVVQNGAEICGDVEKVLCFLRYVKSDGKQWHKVSTEQANAYLKTHHPQYLHYSAVLDANLHAVAIDKIVQHHKPRQRLQQVLAKQQRDKVEQDSTDLCLLFQHNGLDLTQVGVTGSVLLGVQQQSSDIDLVFYDRETFQKARAIIANLIEQRQLGDLAEHDWQEAYARRSCTLTLAEYIWHECRKFNKALINGRKFDLNFVDSQTQSEQITYQKCGAITLQCKIKEDKYGFDYPALYTIDHETIKTVVCFIATYTGQVFVGETVEVSGLLEQAEDGSKQIVVGSSREATGEYIKVIFEQVDSDHGSTSSPRTESTPYRSS